MKKQRLDTLLFQRSLVPSRERAKTTIMSGVVYVDGVRAEKPGMNVSEDAEIEVRGKAQKYVSRGGLKLEKAIKSFGLELEGLVALDVGASTGGFTDCMLQNGAKKVYAVDVGYGQLAWSLRNDKRVACMERTNIRYVTADDIGEAADFCSIDVSFISLKLVLPAVYPLLREGAALVCLIKPQFEAGRQSVGKKGVVRDPDVHKQVIKDVLGYAAASGFSLSGLDFSPVKGPEGNIEYLAYFHKGGEPCPPPDIEVLVNASHASLDT